MYTLLQADGRWFIKDSDERIVGDGYASEFQAELALRKLGSASSQVQILSDIREERIRQDATPGTSMRDQPDGTFLAAACKKLGDAASTLTQLHRDKRNIRKELIELGAVTVSWLEELERRDRR